MTANFDTCVEAAAEALAHTGSVLHFHGSFGSDEPYEQLGATLARIQGGFSLGLCTEIERSLRSRLVVVVGYSGSDFFDVDQMVSSLPEGALDGTTIVWVSHANQPLAIDHTGVPCPLVQLLRGKGATVEIVEGRTSEVLDELAEAWSLKPLRDLAPRALRTPTVSVTDDERIRCSLAMLQRIGMWRVARRLLAEPSARHLDANVRWLAEMELLWEEGQWGTARKSWRRTGPRYGYEDLASERVGACLWAQGRLIPAYTWLVVRLPRITHPDVRLQAIETLGRTVEHMARSPDTRLIVRPLARKALAMMPSTTPADGIDMHRRIVDVRSSLDQIVGTRPRSPGTALESSEWFQQVGSVSATLAYRHRELRDSYTPSIPTAELARLYRAQEHRTLAVGALGGSARVVLLPGAHRVFTRQQAKASLRRIGLAPWHRFRLRVFDELSRASEQIPIARRERSS